jgi:hypothetical protein
MAKQEYNFTPDYDYWWNKPDLTKEELIWVMVGVSPDDRARYQELHNNNDKSPWYWGFYNYFDNKHLFWGYQSKHQECEQCAISWDNKKQFVQDAYNAFIAIEDDFLVYLEGKSDFQKNPDLEKYKGWRQYQLDLENADFDWRINTEEEAFAVFLGLEPKSFKRYYALRLKKENRNKSLPFSLWLNELSPDDTWFFLLYQQFLRDTLSVSIGRLDDIKALNLWKEDFKEYVKTLHNHGVVFSRSFMRAFKKHILPDWEWGYDKDSKIWKLCQDWVNKEKVWTFEQAIFLFTGKRPPVWKGEDKEIITHLAGSSLKIEYSFNEKRYVVTAFERDNYSKFGQRLFDLKERLENHILSGDIAGCDKENTKFKAKDIYKWLRENTSHRPPLALHSAVGDTFEGYLDKQDSNVRETDDGPVLKNRLDSNTHNNRRKELERLKEKMQQAGIQDGEYSQDDIAIFLQEKSLEFETVGHEHIKNIIKDSQIFRFDKGRQPKKKKADKIPLGNRINWDE